MEYTFILPVNIDLDSIIEANPVTHIHGFKKYKLMYVLHTLSDIPSNNKDLCKEDGYIPINAELLRNQIGREYDNYLTYLIDVGIVESDNYFSRPAHKSRGYRFTPPYQTSLKQETISIGKVLWDKLHSFPVKGVRPDTSEDQSLSELAAIHRKSLLEKLPVKSKSLNQGELYTYHILTRERFSFAYKWLDERGLQIDAEAAHTYNEWLHEMRMSTTALREEYYNRKRRRWQYKDPHVQYRANYCNIEKLRTGDYQGLFDTNVFRFHTPLSNMKSELRNFITWKGKNLVAVDLSSSQPALLTGLFDPDFWAGEKKFSLQSLPFYKPNDVFRSNSHLSYIITLCKNMRGQDGEFLPELREYISLIESGEFYSRFRELVNQKIGRELASHKEIKTMMFIVLFTDNRYFGQKAAGPKRLFREVFPSIYELTRSIKAKSSEVLPILLQRIESYIMYHKIVPRITYERPDLPIFPIHDSLVVTEGNEAYVEQIMSEEIQKAIGIRPHFKRDHWSPDKVLTSA